jgi:Phage integrase family
VRWAATFTASAAASFFGSFRSWRVGNAVLQLQAEHLRVRPGEIRCWNEERDRVYYLPLVPTLEEALTSLGIASGPLFRLASGQALRRFPEGAWQKVRAKAELGWVRFHDLRHLALTLLAEEGVPLHVIKAFADHADIKSPSGTSTPGGGPWTRPRGSASSGTDAGLAAPASLRHAKKLIC